MTPTATPVYKPSPIIKYVIIAIVILGVVFRIIAAAPTWLHLDENFYLSTVQNYIDRGELTPYMWRLDPDTNIIAGSGTGYGILLLTNWLKLVGESLFNGRLLMIAVSLATAGVMYAVGRKWWGSREAGIATFLFALVATSPFYTLVMRMDAFGMLMYSIVLLLHIHAVRDNKRWLHFAVGVMVVLSAEFHILGVLYLFVFTIYYLTAYIRELIQRRRIILNTGPVYFAVGAFIVGVVYVVIHVLPNPQAYFTISSRCFQCENQEVMRIARFMILRPVEFVLIFLAIGTAFLRRQPEDRHFLLLYISWLLLELLLGIPPITHYSHHSWPLLALGTTGLFMRGAQPHGVLTRTRVIFGLGLAIFTLFFNLGMHLTGQHPSENRYTSQPPPVLEYVNDTIPPDTVVMAHVRWFVALQQYRNFLSYRDGDDYGIALRGESQLDFWRRWQPLVIIGNYHLEDPELQQYLDEMDFEEVQPNLWIAASLRDELGDL